MKFKFLNLFIILIYPSLGICEEFKITVNPLIDYHQQLKELIKDCNQAGMPEECKEKIKSLSDEIEKLRKYCYKKPNDYRCDGLARKNSERVDPMEELCLNDPYADKCVRHRNSIKVNAVRMVKYCKERPESSRCKPKAPPKKQEPFIFSFCRKNPDKRMCQKHQEEEKLRKDPYYKEDKANLF